MCHVFPMVPFMYKVQAGKRSVTRTDNEKESGKSSVNHSLTFPEGWTLCRHGRVVSVLVPCNVSSVRIRVVSRISQHSFSFFFVFLRPIRQGCFVITDNQCSSSLVSLHFPHSLINYDLPNFSHVSPYSTLSLPSGILWWSVLFWSPRTHTGG